MNDSIIYFDCFGGISGDMALGALLDAGASEVLLREQLRLLPLDSCTLHVFETRRHGIRGLRVTVEVSGDQPHRRLTDILSLINNSGLSERVKHNAEKIFRRLALAEGRVHGISPEEVHFHEVGAADSIVDVAGTCIALDLLGAGQIYCSPLPAGHGTVRCAHGLLPVPAPAVCELMRGLPVRAYDVAGELVTPTGAAIVSSLACFSTPPEMYAGRPGYGFGSNDYGFPGFLRVIRGSAGGGVNRETVFVMETDIDDMNPEFFPHLDNLLRTAGALDVFLTAEIMKKGRPGTRLTVIGPPGREDELADIVLQHSSSLGVRLRRELRKILPRKSLTVDTPLGRARVKIAFFASGCHRVTPEYEDCRRLALDHNLPLAAVYEQVRRAGEAAAGQCTR
ncbi:nickel pincer cofactor biosynthesis protein LarC [Desulfotomaculum copahuensis]|uniref:Pyridinium-3,5-bisthiocarboxylic acid mononucleotide nickel insertion protein n=1 Tax=Desulfotomaculum copahuensis TaxID=1838280 RepID=A0A1B7LAZ0_9FIRM|nr:nickel pincer cofactor biosynthesis protein LarC [Desulfotomaculum copahuensis]OAT79476.1 TIGR00299 family protein [Desulfotomaculum copahuensis]